MQKKKVVKKTKQSSSFVRALFSQSVLGHKRNERVVFGHKRNERVVFFFFSKRTQCMHACTHRYAT